MAGTLRGMHFQIAPHEEAKLVRCTRGAIFDVIVDLGRARRPTPRGRRRARRGHAERALRPEGLRARLPDAGRRRRGPLHDLRPVRARAAAGVRWDDPAFGIEWPARRASRTISERDRSVARLPAAGSLREPRRVEVVAPDLVDPRASSTSTSSSAWRSRPLSSSPRRSRGATISRAELLGVDDATLPDLRQPARPGFRLVRCRVISVRVNPGATENALMPCSSSEAASASVRLATPPSRRVPGLVRRRPNGGIARQVDDAALARARSCAARPRGSRLNAPPRLVRTSGHQSSGSTSQSGPIARSEPALFTSTAIGRRLSPRSPRPRRAPRAASVTSATTLDGRRSRAARPAARLLELRVRSGDEHRRRTRASASASAVARPIPRLAPGDDGDRPGRSRQLARGARAARASAAASRIASNGRPDRSAIASRSWLPSDRLSTQRYASLRVRPVGDALVEAALPELRLAVRRAVAVARVRLDHVDDLERGPERGRRAPRP